MFSFSLDENKKNLVFKALLSIVICNEAELLLFTLCVIPFTAADKGGSEHRETPSSD